MLIFSILASSQLLCISHQLSLRGKQTFFCNFDNFVQLKLFTGSIHHWYQVFILNRSSFSNALVHCSLLLKGCRLCIWIIYTFSKYLLTLFRILEKKELDLKVILRKHSLLSSSRFCLALWQERQSLPDLIKRTKLVCEGWLWGKCVSCLRVPLKNFLGRLGSLINLTLLLL